MATAYTLTVEGKMSPMPDLADKGTKKALSLISIMGSTGTSYTITATDLKNMGLSTLDGGMCIGYEGTFTQASDAVIKPNAIVVPSSKKIVFARHLTYNKKCYFAIIGESREPIQE